MKATAGMRNKLRVLKWRTGAVHEVLARYHIPEMVVATLLIIVAGAVGFLVTEGAHLQGSRFHRVCDATWWSFVTLSTIGYGDIVPKTLGGRLVGTMVGFSGVVVLSLMTAVLASILVERRILEERGLQKFSGTGHRIVCGWNPQAEDVLAALARQAPGENVVLVNGMSEEWFTDLRYRFDKRVKLRHVRGDYTREALLDRAGVAGAQACIILVDSSGESTSDTSDERVLRGTLAIKAIDPEVRVCVELTDSAHEAHLRRARADEVLVRGRYSGLFLSGAATTPGLSDIYEEILGPDAGARIVQLPVPSDLHGGTYGEMVKRLRATEGGTVLGVVQKVTEIGIGDLLSDDMSAVSHFIRRKFEESGEDLHTRLSASKPLLNPPDDYVIREHDSAVVLVSSEDGP